SCPLTLTALAYFLSPAVTSSSPTVNLPLSVSGGAVAPMAGPILVSKAQLSPFLIGSLRKHSAGTTGWLLTARRYTPSARTATSSSATLTPPTAVFSSVASSVPTFLVSPTSTTTTSVPAL